MIRREQAERDFAILSQSYDQKKIAATDMLLEWIKKTEDYNAEKLTEMLNHVSCSNILEFSLIGMLAQVGMMHMTIAFFKDKSLDDVEE